MDNVFVTRKNPAQSWEGILVSQRSVNLAGGHREEVTSQDLKEKMY
jgi:hypothetical protein